LLALAIDSNWQSWVLAVAALVYGAIILMMIIMLVIKSGHTCYKKREKASKIK